MRPRISLKGFVRPSVRMSVGPLALRKKSLTSPEIFRKWFPCGSYISLYICQQSNHCYDHHYHRHHLASYPNFRARRPSRSIARKWHHKETYNEWRWSSRIFCTPAVLTSRLPVTPHLAVLVFFSPKHAHQSGRLMTVSFGEAHSDSVLLAYQSRKKLRKEKQAPRGIWDATACLWCNLITITLKNSQIWRPKITWDRPADRRTDGRKNGQTDGHDL